MANEAKQPQEAQEVTLIIARHDHAADGLLLPDGLVNAYMVGRNMQQAYGIKAIDHVYCSTLVRTQQTMLAQAIGMATHNGFEMPSYTIHVFIINMTIIKVEMDVLSPLLLKQGAEISE